MTHSRSNVPAGMPYGGDMPLSASAYAGAAQAPARPKRFRVPGQAKLSRDTASYDPYRGEDSAAADNAGPRRANLTLTRLEPWSVMKFSFLMSLVAWLVLFVAVALLYYVLAGMGVFAAIQKTLTSVTSSQGSSGASLNQYMSASRILGYTMLLGAVDVVLITAVSTVGSVIYNLVTRIGGGIEVTLRETE